MPTICELNHPTDQSLSTSRQVSIIQKAQLQSIHKHSNHTSNTSRRNGRLWQGLFVTTSSTTCTEVSRFVLEIIVIIARRRYIDPMIIKDLGPTMAQVLLSSVERIRETRNAFSTTGESNLPLLLLACQSELATYPHLLRNFH